MNIEIVKTLIGILFFFGAFVYSLVGAPVANTLIVYLLLGLARIFVLTIGCLFVCQLYKLIAA